MPKKLLLVFILAFALNLVWENLHSPLYFHPDGTMMTQSMLLEAALLDALFISFLAVSYLLTPEIRGKIWILVTLALLVAVVIEWRALLEGRWAYTAAMPLIPLLGTGLTPTLQLPLLSYIVLKLVLRKSSWKSSSTRWRVE